jgi:hypothetical protein
LISSRSSAVSAGGRWPWRRRRSGEEGLTLRRGRALFGVSSLGQSVTAGLLGEWQWRREARELVAELLSGDSKLGDNSSPKRFETPPLGRRKLGRQREEGEISKRSAKPLELGLEIPGAHGQRLGPRPGGP